MCIRDRNEYYGILVRQQEGYLAFPLELGRRESLLLLLCTEEEFREAGFRYRAEKEEIRIRGWKLIGEKPHDLQKEYEGTFYWEKERDKKKRWVLHTAAEEMVEYYVNGRFAGVTLWNPHEIELSGLLEEGENHLRIVVTGNPANRYGAADIPYGLL